MCITFSPCEGANLLCVSPTEIQTVERKDNYTEVLISNRKYKVSDSMEKVAVMAKNAGASLIYLTKEEEYSDILINIYDVIDVVQTANGTAVELSGGQRILVQESAESITDYICNAFCKHLKWCS